MVYPPPRRMARSWDKKLYAINGKTGVKLWEFETGDVVPLPSARMARCTPPQCHRPRMARVSARTVYVGSHKLYAINGKTGGKIWEFETGDSLYPLRHRIGWHGLRVMGQQALCHQWQNGVKLWEFETGDKW